LAKLTESRAPKIKGKIELQYEPFGNHPLFCDFAYFEIIGVYPRRHVNAAALFFAGRQIFQL
jgi:hypothetical protein